MTTLEISNERGYDEFNCQNCDDSYSHEELKPIVHFDHRVTAGERVPGGECPQCGALCSPVEGSQEQSFEIVIYGRGSDREAAWSDAVTKFSCDPGGAPENDP